MKVSDGKIVEITENELYGLYLERNYDAMMPFAEYKWRMEEAGCKVLKGGD